MAFFDTLPPWIIYAVISIISVILLAAFVRLFFVQGETTLLGAIGANLGDLNRTVIFPLLSWLWRRMFVKILIGSAIILIIAYGIDFFLFESSLWYTIFPNARPPI